MPAVAGRHDRTPAPPRAPEKRQRRRKHCFTCILGPAARTTPFDGRRGLLEGSASSTGRASSSSRCALGPFVRRLASELSEWEARSFAENPTQERLIRPAVVTSPGLATWATRRGPGLGSAQLPPVAVAGGGGELSARAVPECAGQSSPSCLRPAVQHVDVRRVDHQHRRGTEAATRLGDRPVGAARRPRHDAMPADGGQGCRGAALFRQCARPPRRRWQERPGWSSETSPHRQVPRPRCAGGALAPIGPRHPCSTGLPARAESTARSKTRCQHRANNHPPSATRRASAQLFAAAKVYGGACCDLEDRRRSRARRQTGASA